MTQERNIELGLEFDQAMSAGAEEETKLWLESHQLPEHFKAAGKWLEYQVRKKTPFYEENQGLTVVVRSIKPPVMQIGSDPGAVLRRAYERWGGRPIYTLKMDPSVLEPEYGPSP